MENLNIDPKTEEELKKAFDALPDEEKEKIKACKSEEELFELLNIGEEIPEEALGSIAGGGYAGSPLDPLMPQINQLLRQGAISSIKLYSWIKNLF